MWRRHGWIHVRRQIKSGRSAAFVRQYLRAYRNLSLAPDSFRERDTAKRKPVANGLMDRGVFDQVEVQQLGDNLPGHIVRRWSQTARDENDFCACKNIQKRHCDGGSIGNDALLVDAQTKFKNLTSNKCQVCVEDIAQQN